MNEMKLRLAEPKGAKRVKIVSVEEVESGCTSELGIGSDINIDREKTAQGKGVRRHTHAHAELCLTEYSHFVASFLIRLSKRKGKHIRGFNSAVGRIHTLMMMLESASAF